jgi:ferredoxin-nitrite reductase
MEQNGQKLNKRERHKMALSPYRYYPQIETLDFSAISEGDEFYLQDFGIFTASIQEDYTLRLRITAGRITAVQLRCVAEIAKEHNLEIILTARAGIQLHGLSSDMVLQIHKQINALGISTWQTFGDNVRNIVTDVFDGIGETNVIETCPIIMQMQEYFLKNPDLVGMLPRRISTGISGNRVNVTSFFANDIYFGLAKQNSIYGFNVYMGGKNTEIAQNADIFLPPEEVVPFFIAFIDTFNTYGLRFTRTRTRLFHLLEEIGLEQFLVYVAEKYQKPWQKSGELIVEPKTFSEFETLKDGRYAFCYETNFGRVTADELIKIAAFAESSGIEIRLSTDHNIYIAGLSIPEVPFTNLTLSKTVVACAGSEYCPYSFWNIKDDASYLLPLKKIREHHIQIGISGCAKGCGRHQHCDIGLIGLRTAQFGKTEKGSRIYLGAEHTHGLSVGRELFEMVPLDHIRSVIEVLIVECEQSGYESFESFASSVLNTYTVDFLALWILGNLEYPSTTPLSALKKASPDKEIFGYEKECLYECFPTLSFTALIEDQFDDAKRYMIKKLWSTDESDPKIAPPIQKLLVSKKYWEL